MYTLYDRDVPTAVPRLLPGRQALASIGSGSGLGLFIFIAEFQT